MPCELAVCRLALDGRLLSRALLATPLSTSVFAGGGVFFRFDNVGIRGDVRGYIGAHVVELSCGLKIEVMKVKTKHYPQDREKRPHP